MNDQAEDSPRPWQREAEERSSVEHLQQPGRSEPATIPYTQLPEARPDSPLAAEWNFYRQTIGRLLAEGHEGKWLLIKNEQIVGIWETQAEADTVRVQRFLMQPVLMKQILAREPMLRIGYNRLWRS
jgi:hypothetical protein